MAKSGFVGIQGEGAVRPPPRSWLQVAVDRVERLPGPTWIAYLVLFLAGTLFWHLIPWAQGSVPVGTIDPPSLYWAFLAPAQLWIAGYLQRGAETSYSAFRPILTMPAAEADHLRQALTVIPARPALILSAAAAVLTVLSVVSDPATYTIGVPLPLVVGGFVGQTLLTGALFQLLYMLIRQTTMVQRTLADAVEIDVFRPGPLHAFATLTSRPGIVISVLVGSGLLIIPVPATVEGFLINAAPYVLVPPIIAVIAFVLPLTGAHDRLTEQKGRLQDDAELRLETILGELNRDVDARDLDRADGLNKTLASLLLQRDVLAKLPTWPWSGTTLRRFASAMLLPMALFLAQQAVSRAI